MQVGPGVGTAPNQALTSSLGLVDHPKIASALGVRSVHGVRVGDALLGADPAESEAVTSVMNDITVLIATRQPSRDAEDPVVSAALYDHSASLRSWRTSIPSAAALWPLYDPTDLADGTPVDEFARRFFTHTLDGRGIRSRGTVVERLIAQAPPNASVLSLAGGAAQPVCRALAAVPGQRAAIVDLDPEALKLATVTAERLGVADRVELATANVLKPQQVQTATQGQQFDVVECIGFFEYLPESGMNRRTDASSFLRLAWSLVAPGGRLIFANMLDSHPQLSFTLHAVRWPTIQPRSVDELLAITDRAGVSVSEVELYLPDDGVYAVLTVSKGAS